MNGWIGYDVGDLALFAQVVDAGGFTAAGRKTGLPQSTISRRIAALEARLGARLLDRSTRRLQVTEVGRRAHDHIRLMLVEAEAARGATDVLTAPPRGVLRVAAPVLMGRSRLPEVVTRFMAEFQDVSIELEWTTRNLDPVEDDVDVVVRVGVPQTTQAWIDDLFVSRLGFFVSPSHSDPDPVIPADLVSMEIFGASRGPVSQTLQFSRGEETVSADISLRLRTNDIGPVIDAAAVCRGVALLPEFAAPKGWRQVLGDWLLPRSRIVALTTRHGRQLPRVSIFVEALAAGMSREA